MKTIELQCEHCKVFYSKPFKEYKYALKVGRKMAFCSMKCTRTAANLARRIYFDKSGNCEYCNNIFISKYMGGKYSRYCSNSCSVKDNQTDGRKKATEYLVANKPTSTVESIQRLLKRKEDWKYVELKPLLMNREYEFEYRIGNYIYDLAILDSKLIIEFDGLDHRTTKQRAIDLDKTIEAEDAGFKVLRVLVTSNTVIPSNALSQLSF